MKPKSTPYITSIMRIADLGCRFRNKLLIELQHGKLRGIEDLVAELAVTFHTEDLQVDIAS